MVPVEAVLISEGESIGKVLRRSYRILPIVNIIRVTLLKHSYEY